jgi:hypothetical protein
MVEVRRSGKARRRWSKPEKRKSPNQPPHVRPSRAEAKEGWTLAQLVQIAGVRERVLKRYLAMGLVPRPPFQGVATRYGREQLVRALAVKRLQAMEQLQLPKVKERLAALTGEQMEALAREMCPPGAAAEALGVARSAGAASDSPIPDWRTAPGGPFVKPLEGRAGVPIGITPAPAQMPAVSGATDLPLSGPGVGRWTHYELGLGLELSIRDDASPATRAFAARIRAMSTPRSDEPLW